MSVFFSLWVIILQLLKIKYPHCNVTLSCTGLVLLLVSTSINTFKVLEDVVYLESVSSFQVLFLTFFFKGVSITDFRAGFFP